MVEETEQLKNCSTCDGKGKNTRGQRCLDCNGSGSEVDESFDDEYEDMLDEEPDADEMEEPI